MVTARVTYRNGRDYYGNIHVDGKAVDAAFLESYGTWSDVEFANILAGVFVPSSKANFVPKKEESIQSRPAFVFQFKVLNGENHSFYLEDRRHQIRYPDYYGRIWIDKATLQLLRIERETAEVLNRPITKAKTTIDYSVVAFGDDGKLVLPVSSDVSICSRPENSLAAQCSHNSSEFIGWQKFAASTNIILGSQR